MPENLYEKLLIPRVPTKEQHRYETLHAETAQEILDHLNRYEFGSIDHVAIALLWKTGLRISGAVAFEPLIGTRPRPPTGRSPEGIDKMTRWPCNTQTLNSA